MASFSLVTLADGGCGLRRGSNATSRADAQWHGAVVVEIEATMPPRTFIVFMRAYRIEYGRRILLTEGTQKDGTDSNDSDNK